MGVVVCRGWAQAHAAGEHFKKNSLEVWSIKHGTHVLSSPETIDVLSPTARSCILTPHI